MLLWSRSMEYAFGILAAVILSGSLVSFWSRDASIGFAGVGASIVAVGVLIGLLVSPLLAIGQLLVLVVGIWAWRQHRRSPADEGREGAISPTIGIEDPRLHTRATLWLVVLAMLSIPVFRAIFESAEYFATFSIAQDGTDASEDEVAPSILVTVYEERAPVLLLVLVLFFGVILLAAARHVLREDQASVSTGAAGE